MNNKTIIEFGFRILWRIMEISEAVIRLGLRPRQITPSLISIILHKLRKPNSLTVEYMMRVEKNKQTNKTKLVDDNT